MPACAVCGVNMTVAEVTQRPYDGVAGNYHRDCAYLEYLHFSGPVVTNPIRQLEIGLAKDKLAKKHIAVGGALTPAAPSGALAASTNLGIGAYKYAVTFVDRTGETLPGTQLNITTTSGNQAVNLTSIPLGPKETAGSTVPLTTKRRIYRTTVGGAQLKLLTTLNDNSTTTFNDTIVDGSLGANAPVSSTYATSDYP